MGKLHKIPLTKNKMDLNNRIMKNHPPFLVSQSKKASSTQDVKNKK